MSREVERRQRAWFAEMLAQDTEPVELMRGMYRRISDPALHTQERLFFELYARALVDGAEVEGFLPEAVELATGDAQAVDAAVERYLSRYEPRQARATTTRKTFSKR